MNILLHVCCGPCAIYPLLKMRNEGHNVHGYFFNPNIHPYQEFNRRHESLLTMSQLLDFTVEYDIEYGINDFFRQVVYKEKERCDICYMMRLKKTVEKASEIGVQAFSTTLLYSKYQKHSMIVEHAKSLSLEYNIHFHYEDFRSGWQEGIKKSKEMNLYRQPYCGCIYSERDRYYKEK